MDIPITIFDTIHLPILWYFIITAAVVVFILLFGAYIIYDYSRGTSLKQLFWGRVKGWTNKKIALFEIFNPINIARFEYAHREIGDVYKFGENSKESIQKQKSKKPGRISNLISILSFKKKSEEIRPIESEISNDVITPKSVYTINSVKTIPLFEPYPKLNIDVEKGINILIEKGIYTLEELVAIISTEKRDEILFDNYTYEKFYGLFIDSKNKYELKITIKDVVGFMSNTFDKNFRFSIESKDFNVKTANKNDKSMQKYSYYILFVCALIAAGMLLYKRIYG